ncbi:MAG: ribosomal protein S18-alanine N-acetyltransferase [Pseudomonadales bacterium]
MNKVQTLPDINGFEFRQLIPGDCAQVAKLHQQLEYSGWNKAQRLQAMELYPYSWVLLNNNQIQSYICYQTTVPQVELLNLGVAKEWQGQGIAFSLLKATIELLPNYAESVFLEVRRSNSPAIGLYQKLGFSKVGERRNYYSAANETREDALVYRYDFK